MPPHRDWTRRGVGRALLWWPFTAFLLVAAFPGVAVPAMVGSGVALVAVGLVGGALGRWWRARRLRRAGRTIGAIPHPATGAPVAPTADTADTAATDTGAIDRAEADAEAAPVSAVDEAPTGPPEGDGPDVRAA